MLHDKPPFGRIGAVAGFVGVIGNVIGVAVLGEIPTAYRPSTVALWVDQVTAAPAAATVSALGFTIGLIALAGWALIAARHLGSARATAAGFLIGVGAVLNAAGTLAPAVVAHHLGPTCGASTDCTAAGAALLGMSLSLDALFNLLLGVGLLLFAAAMWRGERPRWLALLSAAAGLASVPVSLQIVSDAGADLLAVAGPLWLAFITISSVQLWRGRL
jgi:hypothetical protein